MTQNQLQNCIQETSTIIGNTWPLYSFVTSNPLTRLEHKSFHEATAQIAESLGAKVLPSASVLRAALQTNQIDAEILNTLLEKHQLFAVPEHYLLQLEAAEKEGLQNEQSELDRIMTKWLAAFMDEGLAEWTMPNKTKGFYSAWRSLAKYDAQLKASKATIPASSEEVLQTILKGYSAEECTAILTYHLASLPGWTGYIQHRNTYEPIWQQTCPITLEEYLAVRLWIAQQLNLPIQPSQKATTADDKLYAIQLIWLQAWESTWQNNWITTLQENSKNTVHTKEAKANLDAQLVFCIDTRSALIRRHVEAAGNYETYGYAGFFGIAMDYQELDGDSPRKSCPPIVASAYVASESPQEKHSEELKAYQKKTALLKFQDYFFKRMKNMLPSTFGYVEGSGWFYGISLFARTLFPRIGYQLERKDKGTVETLCEPTLDACSTSKTTQDSIALAEKVAIVKSAFDLMGWRTFAPLVVFSGHGSHSANNPFGSSLDCGACAASPGRHNARMLAKLANAPEVRAKLAEEHNIHIPEITVFVGAEHNTTTDEIVIFDAAVPITHKTALETLKRNLAVAQQNATQERLQVQKNGVALAEKKAHNWGETRPEWGLAKNAGFIIGHRNLTKNTSLDGRFFLHSYDWELDTEGKALEGIMQGPMVVTQWINNHYYFASVDNDNFGGGSKITHNVTGKFGVVQGNGGDLKMGLPLQSLKSTDDENYHQPLRLSVIIQAPLTRVTEILSRNPQLQNLLDNQWIYLLVMDPTQNDKVVRYTTLNDWNKDQSSDVQNEEVTVYEEKVRQELEELVTS